MILKILYSYFSLAHLVSLSQRMIQLLTDRFPDHPMISSLLATIRLKQEMAVQAVGSSSWQALTSLIRKADQRRDNSYRSLRDHVAAGLLRENEEYRLACESLWPLFEKNGLRLYHASYAEETAAITSLLKDLNDQAMQTHLVTIHAVEWITELHRDNQAFVNLSQERTAARSTDDTVTDKEAFDQLKTSLDLLCNMLNALNALNEPVGIRETVEELDQAIREATASARQSGSRPVVNQ
ncbi:DUF6261 family protein [Sunxiuqinia sp. sy24]|uniref:DUF6261 family protein n=1 Tax=Sunxiuqinia sp. sy24 TaxID=3461495 RepID=UPI00404542A8